MPIYGYTCTCTCMLPNLSPSPNLQSVYNNNVALWSLREELRIIIPPSLLAAGCCCTSPLSSTAAWVGGWGGRGGGGGGEGNCVTILVYTSPYILWYRVHEDMYCTHTQTHFVSFHRLLLIRACLTLNTATLLPRLSLPTLPTSPLPPTPSSSPLPALPHHIHPLLHQLGLPPTPPPGHHASPRAGGGGRQRRFRQPHTSRLCTITRDTISGDVVDGSRGGYSCSNGRVDLMLSSVHVVLCSERAGGGGGLLLLLLLLCGYQWWESLVLV